MHANVLAAVNVLVLSILGMGFVALHGSHTLESFLVATAAVLATITIAVALVRIAAVSLSRWLPASLGLMALLFTIMIGGGIIDLCIFRIYKFHLNGMIIGMVLSPAAADSVHIGFYPTLAIVVALVGGLALEVKLARWVLAMPQDRVARINKGALIRVLPLLLLVVVVDKIHYGVADLYARTESIRTLRVVPLYTPLTFKRVAARHFGIRPAPPPPRADTDVDGAFRYPLASIRYDDGRTPENVILVMVDALRPDVVLPEVAPNMAELASRSTVFEQHHSGGIATRFGIFTLFYGIDGAYWNIAMHSQTPSVLVSALKDQNYWRRYISATDLDWPEFRRTVFASDGDSIIDQFPGQSHIKDAAATSATIEALEEAAAQDRPFFLYLSLDSAHGPYSYPEGTGSFQPDRRGKINYMTLGLRADDAAVHFNQYRNAVANLDDHIGRLVDAMKQHGVWDSTTLVITGDHGEEFGDAGNFGHNNAFSVWQMRTALLIHRPGQEQGQRIEHMTSHVDVAPTVLPWLGVENTKELLPQNKDLFSSQGRAFVVSRNWNEYALATPDHVLVFSDLPGQQFWPTLYEQPGYDVTDTPRPPDLDVAIRTTLRERARYLR